MQGSDGNNLSKQKSQNSISGSQHFLVVEVRDTGIGMSEDVQKNVMNEYAKASDYQEMNHCGIGLGLSICKKICKGMGGNLTFTSEKDVGTTFKFLVEVQSTQMCESPSPISNRERTRSKDKMDKAKKVAEKITMPKFNPDTA